MGRINMQPGAEPGKILVRNQLTGEMEIVDVRDWTQSYVWDCELIPIGTVITPQQQMTFFANLNHQIAPGARKLRVETSMTEPNRLPGHWRMIVTGIHFGFQPGSVMRPDAQAVIQSAYISFVTGNQRIEREGPMWLFPFPWALAGSHSLDGSLAPTEISQLQNGMPALSAVPKFAPIELPGNFAFQLTAQFDFGFTAIANLRLYAVLSGYLSKPTM